MIILKLKSFFKYYIPLAIVFSFLYGAANYLTELREFHYNFYLPFELYIPFIPEFIFAYLSLNFYFFFMNYILTEKELRGIIRGKYMILIVSVVLFLLFPANLGYSRDFKDYNGLLFLYSSLYTLDKPHNLVPSLHVCFALITMLGISRSQNKSKLINAISIIWFCLIVISTIFTKQHHILDVIAGLVVGYLGFVFSSRAFVGDMDGVPD